MNIKALLLRAWNKLRYEVSFLLGERAVIKNELVNIVGTELASQFNQACFNLVKTELGRITVQIVAALKAQQAGPINRDKAVERIVVLCEQMAIKASPVLINLFISIVESKLEGKII